MSMSSGSGHTTSEINVTPLIDVLLVLLIIFMVMVPVAPKGLESVLPQPPKHDQASPDDNVIVVQVAAGTDGEATYRINNAAISKAEIEPRLASIFAARQTKVMFVKGDTSIEFSKIAEVIDLGHQADVGNIGILTPNGTAKQ